MKKFPFACLLLLLPGGLSLSVGSIEFVSVKGDPLIAGQDQKLEFLFSHEGALYSCFEFVFTVADGEETLYEKKITYFKAPDGVERASFSLPGSLLRKGASLRFCAKLEHTSSSFWGDSYACYQKREVVATPKEKGAVLFPNEEYDFFSFESVYYPHFGMEESAFRFLGVKREKEEKESRLHLERIKFAPLFVSENFLLPKIVGELRIYSSPDMWRIGEKKKKFRALPLSSIALEKGWFGLQLSEEYSFSLRDGTMTEASEGLPKTRDLILPRWADIEERMHFAICLNNFSEGGETLLFYKDAYPDPNGFGKGGGHYVFWEEL